MYATPGEGRRGELCSPEREQGRKKAKGSGGLGTQGCSNSSTGRKWVEAREGCSLRSLGTDDGYGAGQMAGSGCGLGWAGLGERQATSTRCEAVTPTMTHPIKLPSPPPWRLPSHHCDADPFPLSFRRQMYPSTLYGRSAAESCVIRRAQPHSKPPVIGRSKYQRWCAHNHWMSRSGNRGRDPTPRLASGSVKKGASETQ